MLDSCIILLQNRQLFNKISKPEALMMLNPIPAKVKK